MKFEVGKKYIVNVDRTKEVDFGDCDVEKGQVFECCRVDSDGDCWTQDVTWEGLSHEGTIMNSWCVASPSYLEDGFVEEAKD